jgi:hypothetical protein
MFPGRDVYADVSMVAGSMLEPWKQLKVSLHGVQTLFEVLYRLLSNGY